jgi:hypothetical protein
MTIFPIAGLVFIGVGIGSEEHRLVYLVDGDDVVILQARYHYEY